MAKYDFVIAGAGLFGSVFAHEATKRGKSCLVVELRNHIGGNCYTEVHEGIPCHVYGPHCWHTTDARLHAYMQQFATFNNFSLRVKARYGDGLYSFPINLMTLQQLWGVMTPEQAEAKLVSGGPRALQHVCRRLHGKAVGPTSRRFARIDPAPPSRSPHIQ